jgi:hypothetical protein
MCPIHIPTWVFLVLSYWTPLLTFKLLFEVIAVFALPLLIEHEPILLNRELVRR